MLSRAAERSSGAATKGDQQQQQEAQQHSYHSSYHSYHIATNSHRKSQKNPQASTFFSTPPQQKKSLSIGDMWRVCYI